MKGSDGRKRKGTSLKKCSDNGAGKKKKRNKIETEQYGEVTDINKTISNEQKENVQRDRQIDDDIDTGSPTHITDGQIDDTIENDSQTTPNDMSDGQINDNSLQRKNNNNEGETNKKQKRSDEEQQESSGNDDSTKRTRKRRKIQTPNTSDDEMDNIHPDPQSELSLSHNDELILKCAWYKCKYKNTNMDSFAEHVSLHVPHMEIRSTEDHIELYNCLWHLCDFETEDRHEIARHISYHSYHTTLKVIGKNVMKHVQLPICNRKRNKRNIIPKLENKFTCCWERCAFSCNNIHMFLYHVEEHLKQQPIREDMPCGWTNCPRRFWIVSDLEEHVRTHTQEQALSCPNCGSLFESTLQFVNHLKLPESTEVGNFVCPICQERFPTQRYLQRHLNQILTPFTCPFCPFKCHTTWARDMHRWSHETGKWSPDEEFENTTDRNTLHPIIPIDDGLSWANGEDPPPLEPLEEDRPLIWGIAATSYLLLRVLWTLCRN